MTTSHQRPYKVLVISVTSRVLGAERGKWACDVYILPGEGWDKEANGKVLHQGMVQEYDSEAAVVDRGFVYGMEWIDKLLAGDGQP